MVLPDGHAYMPVVNASFAPVDIARKEELGFTESLDDCPLKEINPKFVASVASSEEARRRLSQPLTPEKEAYIRKAANLEHVPEHLRKAYLNLILKHHTAVSQNKPRPSFTTLNSATRSLSTSSSSRSPTLTNRRWSKTSPNG